jgi:hypothetical protein
MPLFLVLRPLDAHLIALAHRLGGNKTLFALFGRVITLEFAEKLFRQVRVVHGQICEDQRVVGDDGIAEALLN